MILLTVSFLLGVITILLLPYAQAILIACVLTAVLVSLIVIFYWLRLSAKTLAILLIGFVAGFGYCFAYINHVKRHQLPIAFEGKTLRVMGKIIGVPQQHAQYTSFIFLINQLNQQATHLRVKLNWYAKPLALTTGERWRLSVRLKRVHGMSNPGGFDYQQYLFSQRILAAGYVVANGDQRLLVKQNMAAFIDRLRGLIAARMRLAMKDHSLAAIPIALSVGVKDDVQPQQWQVFRATGTSHLMAISGLHIGLVAGMLFWLASFFWRFFPTFTNRMPAPHIGAIAALIGALIYSALAGFALPTQRALIMIAVFMFSFLLKRQTISFQSLCLALLLVLIIDPLAPLSAGFWLSFAAVAVIFYGVAGRLSARGLWWKWGRVQWVVSLGLIPIMLVLFQQASIIGLFANLIAIPWFSFLVVPLCLIGALASLFSLPVSAVILKLALWMLQPIWWLLEFLASLPVALWHQSINTNWLIICSVMTSILLLLPRGLPGRGIAVIWILPVFLYQPNKLINGEFKLTVLDVGQGLATVIQTKHHVMVYDTGPKLGPTFDMGESVVVPFLRYQRVKQLDMLMISHADNDHIGGAQSVLASYPAKFTLASLPKTYQKFYYQPCVAGTHWRWDGVSFRVLYPALGQAYADNNSSCVLKVSNHQHSVLLTGDIEQKAEGWLLVHDPGELKTTILVVPHHGSKTSSTLAFLEKTQANFAIVSTGYLNRYRLPNQIVIKRYQRLGTTLFNTVNTGALTVLVGEHSLHWRANRSRPRLYQLNLVGG